MKILFVTAFFFFLINLSFSQSILKFDKRLGESEKHWVVFPMSKDSTYPLGYIYLDDVAGFTFDYRGTLKIEGEEIINYQKNDTARMLYRLQPSNMRVALLPEKYFSQLGIKAFPDFIKIYYEGDTSSVRYLYQKGFQYNAFNEPQIALTFLERARHVDARFNGLSTELAFSYNAIGNYQEAIKAAKEGLKSEANLCYLYKELSYAQIHSGQLGDAETSVKNGIEKCSDQSYKAELPFNIASAYYKLKNKNKFDEWKAITLKYAKPGDMYFKAIKDMESNFDKQI